MRRGSVINLCGVASIAALAGCADATTTQNSATRAFTPGYQGVETHLLDGDLVNFQVAMTGARGDADVVRYAECAAAQYTLIRGFGFARHVRTNVLEDGLLWRGDAVYVISPVLPDGIKKLDAEVVVDDCIENGIPTV